MYPRERFTAHRRIAIVGCGAWRQFQVAAVSILSLSYNDIFLFSGVQIIYRPTQGKSCKYTYGTPITAPWRLPFALMSSYVFNLEENWSYWIISQMIYSFAMNCNTLSPHLDATSFCAKRLASNVCVEDKFGLIFWNSTFSTTVIRHWWIAL